MTELVTVKQTKRGKSGTLVILERGSGDVMVS